MTECEDGLLAELTALYARADALFAGASCDLSTECCRFGITGREPQVTSLEMAMVRRALLRRGGPLSAKKRALPLAGEPPHAGKAHKPTREPMDERICPLLDRAGKCSIYAARPLGCRTFFCTRATLPTPPARNELRDLVRDLQTLASRHRAGGEKGRGFTSALRELG